jgi:hypothetical protein
MPALVMMMGPSRPRFVSGGLAMGSDTTQTSDDGSLGPGLLSASATHT